MTNKKVPIPAPQTTNWASAQKPTLFDLNNPTLGKAIRGTLSRNPGYLGQYSDKDRAGRPKKEAFNSRQAKFSLFSQTNGHLAHPAWYSTSTAGSLCPGETRLWRENSPLTGPNAEVNNES